MQITNIARKSIQYPTCGKCIDVWLISIVEDESLICGSCGDIIHILIEEIINVQY